MGCVHNKRLYFIQNSVYMQVTIIVNRNALRASQPTPPVWACGNVNHIYHIPLLNLPSPTINMERWTVEGDYLNVTSWDNHYAWATKNSNFILLALLKGIVSLTYVQAQKEFHTIGLRYFFQKNSVHAILVLQMDVLLQYAQ